MNSTLFLRIISVYFCSLFAVILFPALVIAMPDQDIPTVNKWIESNLLHKKDDISSRMWTVPRSYSTTEYDFFHPFPPLTANFYDDSCFWNHRDKKIAETTFSWSAYRMLASPESIIAQSGERWLLQGYLLNLVGTKDFLVPTNAVFGLERQKRLILLSQEANQMLVKRLRSFNGTNLKDSFNQAKNWLIPKGNIQDVINYFNNGYSNDMSSINLLFVFPEYWTVGRKNNMVDWVDSIHDLPESDSEINRVFHDLLEDKDSVTRLWLREVYLHKLTGKYLMEGKLPAWADESSYPKMKMVIEQWLEQIKIDQDILIQNVYKNAELKSAIFPTKK